MRSWTPDAIGWCHNCGTYQRGRDAPWLRSRYGNDPSPEPHCVCCRHEEPWEFGVFHVEPVSLHVWPWAQNWTRALTMICAGHHADRQDEGWSHEDCDCAGEVWAVEARVFSWCDRHDAGRLSRLVEDDGRLQTWQADDKFVCECWREHDDAALRALENKSGRGGRGPVKAWRCKPLLVAPVEGAPLVWPRPRHAQADCPMPPHRHVPA
jgi:hypothetical protein